ncbi:ribonuclease R [Paraferrimonas sp. SM1919]|uniref:ribonuclease R n=1 Tax=Paraferrimonas sp. SM1919 TaxID=2662263 RepID=UPI001969BBC3|nr:ribonuclease R [Paraferrimonas sp. SM1919]
MSKDPHLEREQQKYDNPIASREYILEYLQSQPAPLSREQIGEFFKIADEEQWEGLRRRLRAMERDGQLVYTRNHSYGLPERMDLIKGTIIGHRDGFGFLKQDSGEKDLFINQRHMQKYFHGDRVLAQAVGFANKGRQECRIIRLIDERKAAIVGRFMLDGKIGFVKADDKRITQDILIESDQRNGARHNDIVVIELLQRPTQFMSAKAKVVEILGEQHAPGMEIEIALRNHDLPHNWNARIAKLLRRIGSEVSEQDKVGRIDLRHLPLVTIDGEDARDFDDAVYCEPNKSGGWQLWVAIADVSHYVKKGSALDEEALARGNSVYFPSQVIPMLPEQLSNGLCSLNPLVDRLCMVAEMTVSGSGKLTDYRFYPALMHSHARLTYTQVHQALEVGQSIDFDNALMPHLQALQSLYLTLDQARTQRGAIGFETEETMFLFNEQKRIESIVPRTRNQAHKIIEECMIMANVAAAQFVENHKAETLYRVHDSPSEEKLTSYKSFLAERGLVLNGGLDPAPKDYAELLEKVKERDDAELIQVMLLRSMRQAVYSPDNDGHFGLALDRYAHFTSPIRRYPDLQLHRTIRYLYEKQLAQQNGAELSANWTSSGGYLYDADELDELGIQCSMTERRADEATRDVSDWLKCEYMQDHVGQDFEANIASITSFGFFARLKELFIDGLIHVSSLAGDYYHFDGAKQTLRGENSNRVFRIGDKIMVRVLAVNLDDRQIDLGLVNEATGELASKSVPRKAQSSNDKKLTTDQGRGSRRHKRKDSSGSMRKKLKRKK